MKNKFFWFAILAILLLGCRNDYFNPNDQGDNQQAQKFRVVPKSAIPQIINDLQAKTNNFKVPLKNHSSVQGKVETIFGEINTDYIIETTNGTDEIFYTFPITPYAENASAETHNLVVVTDAAETEAVRVIVYEPTAEWLVSGNNDFQIFSGNVYTYSLDGNLESAVAYLNGNCNPEPCPDCPTPSPGPGPGPNTPGNPPTTPGEGDPPTPPNPNPPIPPPSDPGDPPQGPSPGDCHWVCIYDANNECTKMECIMGETPTFTASRAPASDCVQVGGGVVITTQYDLCQKTKVLMANNEVENVVQDLKYHIANGAGGEKGWKINKTGSPTQTTENGDHSVNFDDPSLLNGGYHNHTGTKVDMFSATDISTMIEIARNQTISNGASNAGNGFLGIIAPNGVHYIIRFNGNHASLPPNPFSEFDLDGWNIQQTIQMYKLLKKSEFRQVVNGKTILNSKGLEQILFETLYKMGLENKIVVQKLDSNNNVSTINQNSDGSTLPIPCP